MLRNFEVNKSDDNVRADVFVAKHFPAFSRSSLRKLFSEGMVLQNQSKLKVGERLRSGDAVSVNDDLITNEVRVIELPIIYEDKDVIVVNKPAGVLTHSKGAINIEATVASFIQGKINDKKLTGNRAGVVHRLDRPTSGLIICAKNSKALIYLQKQFSSRKVKKTYMAIVEGVPQQKEAIIDAPIGRSPTKPQSFKVLSGGKSAQTEYHLVDSFGRSGKTFSILELRPVTGRTHQIRVHLSYIGHPVVGDNLYGHTDGPLLLHAKELELNLPSGEHKIFRSSIPRLFKEFART